MEKQIRDIISHYCGGTHENKQIATKQILNLFNVSNCDHSNEVQRQGDGFVYTVCGDCGKDLD